MATNEKADTTSKSIRWQDRVTRDGNPTDYPVVTCKNMMPRLTHGGPCDPLPKHEVAPGRNPKTRPQLVTRASQELARYRAGTMTFDQLVKLWSTRKFDPCPHATTPDEAWQMDEDGEFGGGPGTWDEIVSFKCLGFLTPDEYEAISAASWAYRKGLS